MMVRMTRMSNSTAPVMLTNLSSELILPFRPHVSG
jgi:hypothetical protein